MTNTVGVPLLWDEINADNSSNTIVTIRQNFDGESWQSKWRILNEEDKDAYLIRFKIFENNVSRIGYMAIAIDDQTGVVELLNTKFL